MDLQSVVEGLHPLEISVVKVLKNHITVEEIINAANLEEVQVMRALQWLQNKQVLEILKQEDEYVDLDANGLLYRKKGLPETRLLREVSEEPQGMNEISTLEKEEIGISLGSLKKKTAVELIDGKITITDQGKKLLEKESLEEAFLQGTFPKKIAELKEEEVFALHNVKHRKEIVKIETKKKVSVTLTQLGEQLIQQELSSEEVIESITSDMLKKETWKNKKFRKYDIQAPVPEIVGGKKHFVKQALENAKQIWLNLGFEEMKGNMVQTSFWNFDSLFTAQDHPVREMQDTFFVNVPKGKLPAEKAAIKIAHEGTGESKGWGYKWDEDKANSLVLRTHTTVLSARKLSQLSEKDMPAKFFALGRCFRNEALDWSHLFEFNQTEGIVVDPKANFRHLLGYLKQFFKEMGFEQARFRPAYFPYTEPSVEIDVFHPIHKKWFELGGAGIFRPEVTTPLLGKEVPVLAWGPGFDRLILDYYNIKDIRELYKNDLEQLRTIKCWNKNATN